MVRLRILPSPKAVTPHHISWSSVIKLVILLTYYQLEGRVIEIADGEKIHMAHHLRQLAVAILLVGFAIGGWRAWSPKSYVVDELAVNSGVVSLTLLASKSKSIWIQ